MKNNTKKLEEYSEDVLLMAGGLVQIYTGTSVWEYYDSWFDEPRDQEIIHMDLFCGI